MAINIEDSSALELFMDMGAVRAVRDLLFRLGQRHFGSPDPNVRAAIDSISDLGRLNQLAEEIETASSWQELLAKGNR